MLVRLVVLTVWTAAPEGLDVRLAPPVEVRAPLGAAVAPAVLPGGSLALSAEVGWPDLRVGYRQGLGPVEVFAQGRLDWVRLSLEASAGLKVPLWRRGPWQVGLSGSLGLLGTSGATYLDALGPAALLVQTRVAGLVSLEALPILGLLGGVELGVGAALNRLLVRVEPLALLGAELLLGSSWSLSLLATAGGDLRVDGETRALPALGVRLGLGYRWF